jgi:3-deoxy-D-manno-octulosonate 8-phosphate phosphatase (KDO 8-P phosphatase)
VDYLEQEKSWFKENLKNKELVEKLKKIELIISDIDGCLTDGKVYYSANDHIQKCFSIQDGFLMGKCNKKNMPHIALISGRSDKAAAKRAKILGIPDELYYQGVDKNKSGAVKEIQEKLSLTKEQTIFFGDDILDLETKPVVGLLASPKNSFFYIHENSDIVVPKCGGNGALRLLLDLILYVQNKHIVQDFIKKSIS